MRRWRTLRRALVLGLALLGGCSSATTRMSQTLDARLQAQLSADVAAGRVSLQRLPDGARVTLIEQSLFPNGATALDEQGRNVLTGVIQALLEPSRLHIELAAGGAPAEAQRLQAVAAYFKDVGLEAALPPAAEDGTAAPDVTITLRVIPG